MDIDIGITSNSPPTFLKFFEDSAKSRQEI